MKFELLKKFKQFNKLEKTFLIFLLLSQVYYFFRYAFRVGSTFAPPGYSLTPNYLQYGKYAIALVFFLILVYLVLKSNSVQTVLKVLLKQKIWLLVFFFLAYTGVSLLKFGLNPASFGISQTIKMLFVVPFVFLVPFVWKNTKPFESLKLFLMVAFVYHLIYEAIIILLYFTTGRLPGLAFSNLLPRYGGGWDDPNGFAALCILLILVLMVIPRPGKLSNRVLLNLTLFATVFSFFLAYSVTGMIGLAGCLFVLLICRKLDVNRLAILLLSALIFFTIHYETGYLHLLYEAKIASSVDHLVINTSQNGVVAPPPSLLGNIIQSLFGSFSVARFHEDIYLQTYFNYGIVGLISLVLIALATIYRAFVGWVLTNKEDLETKTFFLVSFIFLGAFTVINAGIPLFQVYPINLFAWTLVGLVWVLPIAGYDNAKNSVSKNISTVASRFIKGDN